MKLIGLSGKSGSGKDTVANYLVTNYNYTKLSFGSVLKDVVSCIFGWPRNLLEGDTKESREFRNKEDKWWSEHLKIKITPRIALQKIGTDVFRMHFHQDIWLLILKKQITKYDKVVVTDIRFLNECNMIKEIGGIIMKISRDNIIKDTHLSENILDNIKFKYNITNNGTIEELNKKINSIVINNIY